MLLLLLLCAVVAAIVGVQSLESDNERERMCLCISFFCCWVAVGVLQERYGRPPGRSFMTKRSRNDAVDAVPLSRTRELQFT